MFSKLDFSLVWQHWDQKGDTHFSSTMTCTKAIVYLHSLKSSVFCVLLRMTNTSMSDWEGRGETQGHKIWTTAKKQCNLPLNFTSLIYLHKLVKKHQDEASNCKRQRGQKGELSISLKPNSPQFHELCLFCPLMHSKSDPRLLEVVRRMPAQAPLPVLQLSRQVPSLRPELWDQVPPDSPGSRGRAQGPRSKHWSLKVPEHPVGPRKPECKQTIFIFSVLTRLRTGSCDWWANKYHNKLQEDLKTWTLEV